MRVVGAVLLLFAAHAVWGQVLPDPAMTPGAVNPDVTQANIHQTICRAGWTATIRPPTSYTNKLKLEQMKLYGNVVPQRPKLSKLKPNLSKCVDHSDDPRCYEEDHDISLEAGGHPTDPRNLRPEPYYPKPGAKEKDTLENDVHKRICSGDILLADGQAMLLYNWLRYYDAMKKRKAK